MNVNSLMEQMSLAYQLYKDWCADNNKWTDHDSILLFMAWIINKGKSNEL